MRACYRDSAGNSIDPSGAPEDHIDGSLRHALETGQGQPYVDEVMAVVRRTMGQRGPRKAGTGS